MMAFVYITGKKGWHTVCVISRVEFRYIYTEIEVESGNIPLLETCVYVIIGYGVCVCVCVCMRNNVITAISIYR